MASIRHRLEIQALKRRIRAYLQQTDAYSCGNELMWAIRPDLKQEHDAIEAEIQRLGLQAVNSVHKASL